MPGVLVDYPVNRVTDYIIAHGELFVKGEFAIYPVIRVIRIGLGGAICGGG
jgi:hypothetical protein